MASHCCEIYPHAPPNGAEARTAVGCGPLPAELAEALELIRAERFEQAVTALRRPKVAADPRALLLTAHARLRADQRAAGLDSLRRALASGRETGQVAGVLCQAPEVLASLCAEALEADIEADYARRLIHAAGLRPPSPTLARWPWPLRLYTLGRAAVVVHGRPLSFSGKAQRRPLLLLHGLIALGGRAVPVARLRHALWEEADGHDTRGAFDMALSRLRLLLDVPGALPLENGHLSLNDRLCWVDVWAWERLLGQVDGAADPLRGLTLLHDALARYQGDFLAGEEAGWAVLARERLHARLLRVARRLGQALEQGGHWAEAGQLYEHARDRFPLDEDLCRRLIRSHIEQDEFAQASSLYARCRELLVKVLGVLPSASTTALIKPILGPSDP